jgi:hypothetical protein
MTTRAATLIRGCLIGIVSGGAAFAFVFFTSNFPVKVHAGLLGALAVLSAITEGHFKGLLSELGSLLRRSTYSVGQLEKLSQTVTILRKRAGFAWGVSMCLKAGVAFAGGLLLWDGLAAKAQPLVIFTGYTFLIFSFFLAFWARQNFRALERIVDGLAMKEASVKEKRRLLNELTNGAAHDFKKDELAQGYTKP